MTRPTIAYLRDAVDLDPDTGSLTWRARPRSHFKTDWTWRAWNRAFVGTPAGQPVNKRTGYRSFTVAGFHTGTHRIVFALHHGYWPHVVNHRDGVRSNNAVSNLEDTDYSGNRHGAAMREDNTSGVVGVTYESQRERWVAEIIIKGKRIRKTFRGVGGFEKACAERRRLEEEHLA